MSDMPEMYLSEEEIVTDMLLYRLVEKEKLTLRSVPTSDLNDLCKETAPAVVKHYRLDDINNPYAVHETPSKNSPTDVGNRIIKKVWSRLTGKPIPAPVAEPIGITFTDDF
jgi:hypothetical protein